MEKQEDLFQNLTGEERIAALRSYATKTGNQPVKRPYSEDDKNQTKTFIAEESTIVMEKKGDIDQATPPSKKTISIPTHKTFEFPPGKTKEGIDKEINEWILERTKAGENPMVHEHIANEHGIFVFAFHTTKIETD